MTIGTNKELVVIRPPFPTNTIHILRLCLFQPTRQPKMQEKTIETPYGKVRVSGKLGIPHLDVFEAICFSREKKKEVDGRIKILVDPWEVKKRSRQMAGQTLDRIIEDLEKTIIEIKEPQRLACIGHLVDHVDTATNKEGKPILRPGKFGEREMWSVEIGKAFCKLLAGDIWVGYDPGRITQLNLRYGISQAVLRHALSHKTVPPGGWKIDTLIMAAHGEKISDALLKKSRERIRTDAEKMSKIGVLVENGRVKLNKDKERDTKASWPDAKASERDTQTK